MSTVCHFHLTVERWCSSHIRPSCTIWRRSRRMERRASTRQVSRQLSSRKLTFLAEKKALQLDTLGRTLKLLRFARLGRTWTFLVNVGLGLGLCTLCFCHFPRRKKENISELVDDLDRDALRSSRIDKHQQINPLSARYTSMRWEVVDMRWSSPFPSPSWSLSRLKHPLSVM